MAKLEGHCYDQVFPAWGNSDSKQRWDLLCSQSCSVQVVLFCCTSDVLSESLSFLTGKSINILGIVVCIIAFHISKLFCTVFLKLGH